MNNKTIIIKKKKKKEKTWQVNGSLHHSFPRPRPALCCLPSTQLLPGPK
jgi:hypothetical protein